MIAVLNHSCRNVVKAQGQVMWCRVTNSRKPALRARIKLGFSVKRENGRLKCHGKRSRFASLLFNGNTVF